MHTSSAEDANPHRTTNLMGALALEAAHAMEQATQEVVGQAGAATAALVLIPARPEWTIEQLRAPLGLSQPGATRLVARLEDAGWVERIGPGGRRGVRLRLTPEGERVFDRLLLARRAAVSELLAPLSTRERDQLTGLLETLLAARTQDRPTLERICRLCERRCCERCPVAHAYETGVTRRSPPARGARRARRPS
jgi:DNA-binding MarR family transcriptional regulator